MSVSAPGAASIPLFAKTPERSQALAAIMTATGRRVGATPPTALSADKGLLANKAA
jgi:hypothetical protein